MFNRLLKLFVGLAAITRSRATDVMQKIEVQPGYDDRLLDQTAQNLTPEDILLDLNIPKKPKNSNTQTTTNFDPIAESIRLQLEAERIAAEAQQRIDSGRLFPNVKNPPSFWSSLELINRAIELNPNGEWFHFDRGHYLAALGKNKEAIESFTKEIEFGFFGSAAHSYFKRAIAHEELGDLQSALSDYEDARSRTSNQNLIKTISEFRENCSQAWEVEKQKSANVRNLREMATNLAHDNSLTSEMQRNVEEISKYLTSNDPENYRDKLKSLQFKDEDLASLISLNGLKSFQKKDYIEAIRRLNDKDLTNLIDEIKKDYIGALSSFDKQEEIYFITPSDFFVFRGLCRMILDQNAEAVTDFNQAIEINDNKQYRYQKPRWLYHLRGMALTKTGEFDKAIKDFDAELEINPNTESHAYKGVIHKTLGNEKEAEKEFNNTWFDNFCAGIQYDIRTGGKIAILGLPVVPMIIAYLIIRAINQNIPDADQDLFPNRNPIAEKSEDEVKKLLKILVDPIFAFTDYDDFSAEQKEAFSKIESEKLTEISQALSAAKDSKEVRSILSEKYKQDYPEEITDFLFQVYGSAAEHKKVNKTIETRQPYNFIYNAVQYEKRLPRIDPKRLEKYTEIFYEIIRERLSELQLEEKNQTEPNPTSTEQETMAPDQALPHTEIEPQKSSPVLARTNSASQESIT